MKRLWWVAVLVTIAFAICFTEIYAIKNSRDTFTKTIEESRIAMENKDYKKAKELSEELIKKWDKQEKNGALPPGSAPFCVRNP